MGLMTDTLRYVPHTTLDATMISPASRATESVVPPPPASLNPAMTRRSTVLPRVEWSGEQANVVPFERERFEEVRALGQGGMGEVVLLKDHDIERMVALKRLPEAPDADRVMRFVEEVRTVGQLDHPNIVPVHDVGVDHLGRYYFVMKHLQGETLESIIERLRQGDAAAHARFPFRIRVEVFLGVLNAVTYAHRKGVIHRDLKPANIMVGPYGEVTVVDWGLARRLDTPDVMTRNGSAVEDPPDMRAGGSRRTQLGTVVGTPLYMSPEQARGQHDQVDVRSDIYSLSVLFHEFLYLSHYLDGKETLVDVLEGVQHTQPAFCHRKTHALQPVVPAEYSYLMEKGLAKDPAQRFQTVEEMAEELRGALDGRIHVRCQRTMVKRGLHEALRRADEHPLAMLLGGLAVTGLALALVVHLVWLLMS